MISGCNAEPPWITMSGTDSTNIAATVLDRQNNVNEVTIDLSSLGGSKTADMTKSIDNLWLIENVHYQAGGTGEGTHYLLITASSVGLTTYNYVPVEVTAGGIPPFSAQIQQDSVQVSTSTDVGFKAILNGGKPSYYCEWDMNYDGTSFTPNIDGENIKWKWNQAGDYKIRLRAIDSAGLMAFADASIQVSGSAATARSPWWFPMGENLGRKGIASRFYGLRRI